MSDVDDELSRDLMRPTFVSEIFDEIELGLRDAFRSNLRREADRLAPTVALNAAEVTLRDARDAAARSRRMGQARRA